MLGANSFRFIGNNSYGTIFRTSNEKFYMLGTYNNQFDGVLLGNNNTIAYESWPTFDESKIVEDGAIVLLSKTSDKLSPTNSESRKPQFKNNVRLRRLPKRKNQKWRHR